MALDIIAELIERIEKTDINSEQALLEFGRYAAEFRLKFNTNVTLGLMKPRKQPGAEDFNNALYCALLQAVENQEAGGLKLDKKISSLKSELEFVKTDKGKKIATIDEALGSMPRTSEIVTAEIKKATEEKDRKLDNPKVKALYDEVKKLDPKSSPKKPGR